MTSLSMNAITGSTEKIVTVKKVQIPVIDDTEVLVKVKYAGLNPTDTKHAFLLGYQDAIPGCDYAGIVEQVGGSVVGWKKGDRIAGAVHGGVYKDRGSFAEYTKADPSLAIHVPEYLDLKEAACLGVSVTTVAQSLYQVGGMPLPPTPGSGSVLIWGGSSGTGVLAIQMAKLSGYKVTTTCSQKHFEYMKELGADCVFDYKDPEVGEKVKNCCSFDFALDTISIESTFKACCQCLGGKGLIVGLLQQKNIPDGIKYVNILAYTAFGKEFVFAKQIKFPPIPKDHEFAAEFWKRTEKLIAENKIKFWKVNYRGSGLESGIQAMKDFHKVGASGEKYVFSVELA